MNASEQHLPSMTHVAVQKVEFEGVRLVFYVCH